MKAFKTSARLFGVVLLLGVAGVGCQNAAYRHDIEGKVVDAAGQPLADCVVTRVTDKGDPYGHDELYRRTTDKTGTFKFESSGRGPTPLAYAPWRLKAELPNKTTRTVEFDATWSNEGATCFGYCNRDVTISFGK